MAAFHPPFIRHRRGSQKAEHSPIICKNQSDFFLQRCETSPLSDAHLVLAEVRGARRTHTMMAVTCTSCGGPYDAAEELRTEFEGLVPDDVIEELENELF